MKDIPLYLGEADDEPLFTLWLDKHEAQAMIDYLEGHIAASQRREHSAYN